MADKKISRNEEIMSDEQLDKVAGGTGGCGSYDVDGIHDEEVPGPDPVIPKPEYGKEVDVINPPLYRIR